MITLESQRPAHRVALPRRNHHGGHSPAWLLVQAAQLSWEIHTILELINGARLDLSEELALQQQATDALMNAAHAGVIVESRMPLAPAWGRWPPRARSIFAQAREAGSDPQAVTPDWIFSPRPPIDPEYRQALAEASHPDPVERAQCTGTNLRGVRCAKRIVSGIGAEHCPMHLTPAEYQRREQLRTAREQIHQAYLDTVEGTSTSNVDTGCYAAAASIDDLFSNSTGLR
ncbi:hypothetical protein [Planobispora rosea]|uniref:hypothetical protein n=1 Tax=Planobispora rosea TaxID=35762 RepID=UPI0009FC9B8E|nr:hypothetical protein [Planobispora rosea]